ncbi:PQQ-binding-like beta-propeller repeat protein [Nitriliruptor alkaliphilus]|uniref:outer membrane protein assembly factor BamB family protein n=1 Tax=Nitriliruptor alkaliphilus TaxID=427918 RepID=UPI000698632B|nr:PQQ-binding-like beta-propeller repeat protein [Nitriliruptor alkaliphilus]
MLLGIGAVVPLMLLVVAGERLVARGGGPGVRDAAVDALDPDALEDVRQRPPGPEPAERTRPTCDPRSPDCFLWSTEVELAGFGHVVAGDEVVAYREVDGGLTGRDLRDGSVLWTASGVASTESWWLASADDLIIHRDEDGLVARSLSSGEVRWRNEEFAWLEVHEVQVQDGVILVAGQQPVSDHEAVPQGAMVGGFDAVTGALRWAHSGASTSVAHGGIGVSLTDDARVEVYGPGGDLRWDTTVELEHRGIHVSGFGHLVTVTNDHGEAQHFLAGDGTPLAAGSEPLATDVHQTLLAEAEPENDAPATDQLLLVDAEGPVWRQDLDAVGRCFREAQLEARTVTFTTCGGGSVVLDREDGSLLTRTELNHADRSDADEMLGYQPWRIGPLEVRPSITGEELLLRDVERDAEIATFTTDTFPVGDRLGGVGSPRHSGVLLLAGDRWLTAIDVGVLDTDGPDADPPPG